MPEYAYPLICVRVYVCVYMCTRICVYEYTCSDVVLASELGQVNSPCLPWLAKVAEIFKDFLVDVGRGAKS